MQYHYSLEELPLWIEKMAPELIAARYLFLQGEMGAGKTTFVQAFCRFLGVEESVKSPTFNLIHQYISQQGLIFHADFFRIENEKQARNLDLENQWEQGFLWLIEWPEKVNSFLPEQGLFLFFEKTPLLEERKLTLLHKR